MNGDTEQRIPGWSREFFEKLTQEVADELGVVIECYGQPKELGEGTYRWELRSVGGGGVVRYNLRPEESPEAVAPGDMEQVRNAVRRTVIDTREEFNFTAPADSEQFKQALRKAIREIQGRVKAP